MPCNPVSWCIDRTPKIFVLYFTAFLTMQGHHREGTILHIEGISSDEFSNIALSTLFREIVGDF